MVCGPLPPQNFTNGKSCIDGSEPLTVEEFEKTKLLKELTNFEEGDKPGASTVTKFNREAQELYGKNCASGKCYYHIFRGAHICSSSATKPLTFLVIILAIYSILLPARTTHL